MGPEGLVAGVRGLCDRRNRSPAPRAPLYLFAQRTHEL
jgi:hypothetical protein